MEVLATGTVLAALACGAFVMYLLRSFADHQVWEDPRVQLQVFASKFAGKRTVNGGWWAVLANVSGFLYRLMVAGGVLSLALNLIRFTKGN